MAFTLQWPNTNLEKIETGHRPIHQIRLNNTMSFEYKEKINFMSPVICVQGDVLYPNAWAAVNNIDENGDPIPTEANLAVGCKGHQIDNEFPLQSRVPVALPLLQYPTNTQGSSTEDQDMCALPVVNWESYIREFRLSASHIVERVFPRNVARRKVLFGWRSRLKRANGIAARKRAEIEAETDNSVGDGDGYSDLDVAIQTSGEINLPENGVTNDKTCEVPQPLAGAEGSSNKLLRTTSSTWELQGVSKIVDTKLTKLKNGKPVTEYKTIKIPKCLKRVKHKGGRKGTSKLRIRQILFRSKADFEAKEKDDLTVPVVSQAEEVEEKQQKIDFRLKKHHQLEPNKVPLLTLRKYKNQPDLKVMGTWNFMYGGTGACNWMYDSEDYSRRNIFVGNGTKLRMASLKPAKSFAMLSYALDSVWDEDDVPTNIRQNQPEKDNLLSDLIFKIVAPKKKKSNLVYVQRGRSLEIYRIDPVPTLLTCIPNICYGTRSYRAGHKTSSRNPLIISSDANPYHQNEVVTLDQNNVLRFADFVAGETTKQFQGEKVLYKIRPTGIYSRKCPEIRLNETLGVVYANHPSTFYQWYDSQIYFHDQRMRMDTDTKFTEVLSLRTATSSLSWSDQRYFRQNTRMLTEYVSAVKPSRNSTYYYVGTSGRILLMDMRVPRNPVLKMSHGMRSAASYIDTHKVEHYEVLVAGSQRIPQTFCAVHDFTHVSCFEREYCKARNPILQSYPRLLSNSRDFFEYANRKESVIGWECDYQRAKDHCYAWTTGLCVLPGTKWAGDPRVAPGVIVVNGNSYGDVFYQEWDARPLEVSRETEAGSRKLKTFLSEWSKAMTSKSFNTYRRPSENRFVPVDCSLLIEPNAAVLKRTVNVGDEPFDPITPHEFVYARVNQSLKPVMEQVKKLKKFKGRHVEFVLRPWTRSETGNDMQILPEQEAQDEDDNQGKLTPEQVQELDIIKQEIGEDMEQEHRDETNYDGAVEFMNQITTTPIDEVHLFNDDVNSQQDIFAVDNNVNLNPDQDIFEDDMCTSKIDNEEYAHPPEEPEVIFRKIEHNFPRHDSGIPIPIETYQLQQVGPANPDSDYLIVLDNSSVQHHQNQADGNFVLQYPDNYHYPQSGEEEEAENAYVMDQNMQSELQMLRTTQFEVVNKIESDDCDLLATTSGADPLYGKFPHLAETPQFQSTSFGGGSNDYPIAFIVPQGANVNADENVPEGTGSRRRNNVKEKKKQKYS